MNLVSLPIDLNHLTETGVDVKVNVPLSEFTTFQLGGFCPCCITCQTPQQLLSVIKILSKNKIDFILIGGGSNLLVSDEGVECAVIRYVSQTPLISLEGNDVAVSASTLLDQLAVFAAEKALEGANYCTGIPGTVGGAIVGNAGAFGKQVGDYLKSVTLCDRNGNLREASPGSLGFRYRHSNLKETEEIVVSARFKMKSCEGNILKQERQEILALRNSKHPNLSREPSAGSFYRNIEPTSKAGKRQAAGWFLQEAGAKQMRFGGAVVFEKHANIIIKSKDCLAQDVFELSKLMARAVKTKFGLDLIREVRLVGKFKNMPHDVQSLVW